MSGKTRLDQALVEQGLAPNLDQARRLVMAGQVRVEGQRAVKPDRPVTAEAALTVEPLPRFVSRGGEKLAGALDGFAIDVGGIVAADVGASTGGFTDCLLQRGVVRVYAIDSGTGQLHWRLRQDARVVSLEQTNARHLASLPERVGLVSVDVSFISLTRLLPSIAGWLDPGGQLVALVKPQFEAEPAQVAPGGVVRDPAVQRLVLLRVMLAAQAAGFGIQGWLRSPLVGPKGNVEFFFHGVMGATGKAPAALMEGFEQRSRPGHEVQK
jgi:23S rRNA (cytidine1920-2'-O)/16S rRNA (cytidine1409-2'-O)-methyltransferase